MKRLLLHDADFNVIMHSFEEHLALKFDETPDYAALEEDIKKMLFDEAKFNMMFEEALNVFNGRL